MRNDWYLVEHYAISGSAVGECPPAVRAAAGKRGASAGRRAEDYFAVSCAEQTRH
jgi:hypothetical protein